MVLVLLHFCLLMGYCHERCDDDVWKRVGLFVVDLNGVYAHIFGCVSGIGEVLWALHHFLPRKGILDAGQVPKEFETFFEGWRWWG
jgi:hypothetical protein